MMKNKKAIWLLAPLVLLVWGLVIYRITGTGNDNNNSPAGPAKSAMSKDDKRMQKDAFTIVADYRDPFLGTLQRQSTASDKVISKPKMAKAIPPPVTWPAVSYAGIIRNKHSNKQVAIVTVNKKEVLMAEKDVSEGVELTQIYNKDSIRISYQDNNKVIHKQ